MKQKYFIQLLMILLVVTLLGQTEKGSSLIITKIQPNDIWQYQDSLLKVYNETAGNTTLHPEAGALSPVNTTRLIYNPAYNYLSKDISISLFQNTTEGNIYVTQKGGIPLYTNRNFSGSLSFSNRTTIFDRIIPSQKPIIFLGGNPALALSTNEPVRYTIQQGFVFNTSEDWNNHPDESFTITSVYFISNTIIDTNYTIQISSISATVLYGSGDVIDFRLDLSTLAGLQLENEAYTAQELSYTSNNKLPVYIRQTEPIGEITALQVGNTIAREYFLVQQKTSSIDTSAKIDHPIDHSSKSKTTETDDSFYPVLGLIAFIPLIYKKEKQQRRN